MTRSCSSLTDWLVRLESYSPHEIDLGLDRVRAVLERLDLRYPRCVLHVAGTNGKGSTVSMAQALLSMSGATVGSYTSPHVFRFNERIRVAGTAVGDEDIVAAFERVDAVRGKLALTYFEFGTIAAMVVFEAHDVDVAILEVGMGGRLDAVNAVEPAAGLITNVTLDHCDWLGNDVETIAIEKAGIMRADKPIVFASKDVPAAIEQEANRTGADLLLAGRDYSWQISGDAWRWSGLAHRLDNLAMPSLVGTMQLQNAAGVLALIECAGFDLLLDAGTVNKAFGSVSLPGRMQTVHSDREWVLDVAHNPAAAVALAATLAERNNEHRPTGNTIAIVGMLDDKDIGGIIAPLAPVVDKWVAVRADNPRAVAVDELARVIANATNKACLEAESIEHAIAYAREVSDSKDRVLITGSFYVVGPALETLGLYSPR